ncbi:MAG: MlrC family protein 3 [Robiginitomaculum sp.]|nr:MAG: MlrC family protein 3 [Robiginitomaculum sp.]
MVPKKRIAVLGLALESNSFAPVCTRADFESLTYAEGAAMLDLSYVNAQIGRDGKGFGAVMSAYTDWEVVPILFGAAGASGPCHHDFFAYVCAQIKTRLQAAGPLDGVYIIGHGAGITTELDDMDGPYFALVRDVVGPDVPVIVTLDLHANVSEQMVEATDILISFQTNPHLDMVARSADAARLMIEMFEGMKPVSSFIRLPLVTAQVSQLTGAGRPYGDLVLRGQAALDDTIACVSILSGFAFADSRHNGLSVIVTARENQHAADVTATRLAQEGWADRHRYAVDLVTIDEAVALAKMKQTPIILADVADNPGGGGRGNTTELLRALHSAKLTDIQIGIVYDPALVEDAWEAGEGHGFTARFTRDDPQEWSKPFTAQAKVVKLIDEPYTSTRGLSNGQKLYYGRSCLLEVGGISIAIISIRQQIFGADALEFFGLTPAQARCIVVKSRGHFRAGFMHMIAEENIFHVDVPGLATPNLHSVDWKGLPRPVFPLDAETRWP